MIFLSQLKNNETGRIKDILGSFGVRRRLELLGLRPGKEIRVVQRGFSGPITVDINGAQVAIGRGMASKVAVEVRHFKILLMGNPNVGKSALFSKMTSLDVISSNYPGTTVDYFKGTTWINNIRTEVLDAPGAYSLTPCSKAEDIACCMIDEEGIDLVIDVVDAMNLERNLYLTLQILEKGLPTIIVLNKWDLAKNKGILIDIKKLSETLKAPVLPLVAVTAEGLKDILDNVGQILTRPFEKPAITLLSDEEKWKIIGQISKDCQTIVHRHPTFLEKLADACLYPATGIPIAVLILGVSFYLIRFIGESLIKYILDPIFNNVYQPILLRLADALGPASLAHSLLVGTTQKAMESFGVLTTGVYIPFVIVLPYLLSFYLVLSFLEDLGYLPRIATLLDRTVHRFGLHGFAAIPIILGLGCKVPAVLASRVLEDRRQKFIAMALMLMIAPCMPQTAMIFSMVIRCGLRYILLIFSTLFIISLLGGLVLNKLIKGQTPELVVEIPPYQMPRLDILFKKVWIRVRGFLFEATPLIMFGIFLVNIFDILGIIKLLTNISSPVVTNLLGLPKEVAPIIVLGFLRKDVSIALLAPFNLTAKQLVIASIFLVLYLPCLATTFIMTRELGMKDGVKLILLTFTIAVVVSFLLNLII